MKIIDLLNEDKVTLSFEVFPPKTSSKYENVLKAAEKIASLNPSFMSGLMVQVEEQVHILLRLQKIFMRNMVLKSWLI